MIKDKISLVKEFKAANPLAIPKVVKIVVNVSLKEMTDNKAVVEKVADGLALITGQKPKLCRAKQAIAGFNLRTGTPIGLKVTLRRKRMEAFLSKLFNVVLPRIKDFQGLSLETFDGQGNYSLGLAEQIVFPEIDPVKIEKIHGLEITIVTDAKNNQQAERLLGLLGAPFKKEDGQKK